MFFQRDGLWRILGVVSRGAIYRLKGTEQCATNAHVIYTSVRPFLVWIRSNVKVGPEEIKEKDNDKQEFINAENCGEIEAGLSCRFSFNLRNGGYGWFTEGCLITNRHVFYYLRNLPSSLNNSTR
jgi:hypothetical protein